MSALVYLRSDLQAMPLLPGRAQRMGLSPGATSCSRLLKVGPRADASPFFIYECTHPASPRSLNLGRGPCVFTVFRRPSISFWIDSGLRPRQRLSACADM